jgi:hypothetical protein
MSYLRFKGIQDYGETTVSDELMLGLQAWMNNAFLNIGAFSNVTIPTTGAYGGSEHIFRIVSEPNYSYGQVFESFRSNWVYESGIDYSSQPISISGIFVNGTYYPIGTTGTYSYTLNYPLGRVIFNNAIPESSVVSAAYSFRYVNVYNSQTPWFMNVMDTSLRRDLGDFSQAGSGIWSILGQSRVQLPAVIIDPSPRFRLEGLELGNSVQNRYQDVLIHVLAEEPWTRNKIADDLSYQRNKQFYTFDYDKILNSGVYPIKYDGSLNPSGLLYPALIPEPPNSYRKNKVTITEIAGQEISSDTSLFRSVLRYTCWIYTP